jgi:uncharacterized protein YggE
VPYKGITEGQPAAGAATPIEPGTQDVTVSVTVTWSIE